MKIISQLFASTSRTRLSPKQGGQQLGYKTWYKMENIPKVIFVKTDEIKIRFFAQTGRIISSTSHLPSGDDIQTEPKPFVIPKQQWESRNRDSNLRKSGGQTITSDADFSDLSGVTQVDVASSAAAASKNIAEVILRDAYKEDNSIIIKWESETSQILGFRVVYRLFGKPEFKQGPPLAPSEREFRIKNVPQNVSGDDLFLSAAEGQRPRNYLSCCSCCSC